MKARMNTSLSSASFAIKVRRFVRSDLQEFTRFRNTSADQGAPSRNHVDFAGECPGKVSRNQSLAAIRGLQDVQFA